MQAGCYLIAGLTLHLATSEKEFHIAEQNLPVYLWSVEI